MPHICEFAMVNLQPLGQYPMWVHRVASWPSGGWEREAQGSGVASDPELALKSSVRCGERRLANVFRRLAVKALNSLGPGS